jgi:hypothetical protein
MAHGVDIKQVGRDVVTGGLGNKGIRGALFGSGGKQSFQEVPGVISRKRGGELAELGAAEAGRGVNPTLQGLLEQNLMNRPTSPYQSALDSALVNPAQFGGLSESENNLVDQAYSGRQAQFNALGIGSSPLAQSAIAAAGAGPLAQLRQQRVENLMTGQGQFDTRTSEFMKNLLESLKQSLALRGQTLESYLNLARLGQPQTAQTGTGASPGIFAPIQLSAGMEA